MDKYIIIIEKRQKILKMERFIANDMFELKQKMETSFGKYWTIADYNYSIVTYNFLLSRFKEINDKIDHLYKLINCEKFEEFDLAISRFRFVDINMYNVEFADKINHVNMYLDCEYIKLSLINFSHILMYDLRDESYRFPRCQHFNSKVTHHLNTAIGKFLLCYECAKLTCDDLHADDVNIEDDYGNLHHLFEDYNINFFIHSNLKKIPETIGAFLI